LGLSRTDAVGRKGRSDAFVAGLLSVNHSVGAKMRRGRRHYFGSPPTASFRLEQFFRLPFTCQTTCFLYDYNGEEIQHFTEFAVGRFAQWKSTSFTPIGSRCCPHADRTGGFVLPWHDFVLNLPALAGVVAQLVERLVRNEKVRGSTPLGSTSLVINKLQF
jgi:hypothetical protein